MLRRLASVLALAAAGAVLVAGVSRLDWSRVGRGGFVVGCAWSHSSQDDAIVHPNDPGASHSHDFFGNTSTNARSTRGSLLAAGTTCRNDDDTAAVWSPSPYLNGIGVTPLRERTYYFGAGRPTVRSLPAGLKMLAGDMMASSPDDNPRASWFCGGGTPVADHPYDCTPYRGDGGAIDGITGMVDFPQCWDGVHLDSPDHTSHLAYRPGPSCPSDHPVLLPRLRVRIHRGVWDPCAGLRPCSPTDAPADNIRLSLASGPYWTLHADYWNTWHQDALDDLVTTCLRTGKACHDAM